MFLLEDPTDFFTGKGRGLVAVLHGPPGTGKTLTAEGIAELLKRPLYMVSVGELGTNSRDLETELNKILDVAHSWGAVLLLDEADVFLGMFSMPIMNEIDANDSYRSTPTPRRRQKRPREHLPSPTGIFPRHPLSNHQPRSNLRPSLSIAHPCGLALRRIDSKGAEERMEDLPRQSQGY